MNAVVNRLVVENLGWIRRRARTFCHHREDAEDLASETVCKILSNSHLYRPGTPFRPWAAIILRNTYITWYNHRQCCDIYNGEDGDLHISSDRTDSLAILNQTLDTIRKCKRDSRCVECVLLYVKGYTYEEIGQMMGITVGTVKSRMLYGRGILRRSLDL